MPSARTRSLCSRRRSKPRFAQRGYFVSKSFTKDTEAQALKDRRITLLTATEHNPALIMATEGFQLTALASYKTLTTFRAAG